MNTCIFKKVISFGDLYQGSLAFRVVKSFVFNILSLAYEWKPNKFNTFGFM